MLRGDNGILNRSTEAKFANGIAQFDEQTKLASMAVRTSIEANKVSKAGYIATYNGIGVDDKNYFTGLVNEVAKELGVSATAGGSGTILKEGYTVAYYLEKEGSTTQNGNGYIVIWYTDNGLRSTMDREKAITNYGLTDVASEGHKTANEAVLVTVIHVENYKSELAIKGITSLTDSDSDIGQPKFGDTTLNGQLGFSSSPTTNNTIQIEEKQHGLWVNDIKISDYSLGEIARELQLYMEGIASESPYNLNQQKYGQVLTERVSTDFSSTDGNPVLDAGIFTFTIHNSNGDTLDILIDVYTTYDEWSDSTMSCVAQRQEPQMKLNGEILINPSVIFNDVEVNPFSAHIASMEAIDTEAISMLLDVL